MRLNLADATPTVHVLRPDAPEFVPQPPPSTPQPAAPRVARTSLQLSHVLEAVTIPSSSSYGLVAVEESVYPVSDTEASGAVVAPRDSQEHEDMGESAYPSSDPEPKVPSDLPDVAQTEKPRSREYLFGADNSEGWSPPPARDVQPISFPPGSASDSVSFRVQANASKDTYADRPPSARLAPPEFRQRPVQAPKPEAPGWLTQSPSSH